MDFHFSIIVIIMFVMGILGGIINYYINDSSKMQKNNINTEMIKVIVIGIGASLLVPLFLNMISSNLLEETKGNYDKTLVFAGFCLIAAIASRSFIDSIADTVLKQVEEALETAKKAKESSEEVKRNIEPILTKETEQEGLEEKITDDTDDIRILKALAHGHYTYRCLDGICNHTNISREIVYEKLNELITNGLVGQLVRDYGLRYYITEKGRKEVFTYNKFETVSDFV